MSADGDDDYQYYDANVDFRSSTVHPRRRNSPPEQQHQRTSAIRTLDDIKNVFENEAETAILNAIEQNEKEYEQEGSPCHSRNATSDILAGIPSEAVHLFDHAEKEESMRHKNGKKEVTAMKNSIHQPTSAASPSLKDIANRLRMMQAFSKSMAGKKADHASMSSNEADPESLTDAEQNDGNTNVESGPMDKRDSGREEAFAANVNSNYNFGSKTTTRTKALYHRYCGPCEKFTRLVKFRWKDITYVFKLFLYLVIPVVGLSAILFYGAGNPIGPMGASYSWWLLFIVRLSITFLLAEFAQFVLIDFIALETRLAVRAIGRMLTLMAVQAKGWPLIIVLWCVWNFILIHGTFLYANHWLFMQKKILVFNESNPAGNVLSHPMYTRILAIGIFVGIIVMVKRVLVALISGKKNYRNYGPTMERIMRKVLLISEVALLAEDARYGTQPNSLLSLNQNTWLFEGNHFRAPSADKKDEHGFPFYDNLRQSSDLYEVRGLNDDVKDNSEPNQSQEKSNWMIFHGKQETKRDDLLHESDSALLESLLGEWEEPETDRNISWKDSSVRKILQFREALNYLQGRYPLSVPFGLADTRKHCMDSAQIIYRRLLSGLPEASVLHFDALMPLTMDKHGKLRKNKVRALIRLFRPDREGRLTLLDFVRSCDAVYKSVKMFRVTVSNAVQLDEAFETIMNIIFYFLLILVVIFLFGVNALKVFTGLASVFLPLSFLFGAAASNWFEGILLVLVRQPYDIGDRVAVADPMDDSHPDGSTTWFVENVTLFTTTARCAVTNEVATYSNGSLASLRIINAARSPKAIVSLKFKFGIDVPYEKVKIFSTTVEKFVKDRPREWIKIIRFGATVVESDLGYIQYILIMQHVESWQNIGIIRKSLADVASFNLEVSKKMDMRFIAPPMPVDLRLANDSMVLGKQEAAERETEPKSNDMDLGGIQMISKLFGHSDPDAKEKKKK